MMTSAVPGTVLSTVVTPFSQHSYEVETIISIIQTGETQAQTCILICLGSPSRP